MKIKWPNFFNAQSSPYTSRAAENLCVRYNQKIDDITARLKTYFDHPETQNFFEHELLVIRAAKLWMSRNFLSEAGQCLERRAHVQRSNFYSRGHLDCLISQIQAQIIENLTEDERVAIAQTKQSLYNGYQNCLRHATGSKAAFRLYINSLKPSEMDTDQLNKRIDTDCQSLFQAEQKTVQALNDYIQKAYSDLGILKETYITAMNNTIESIHGFFKAYDEDDIDLMIKHMKDAPNIEAAAQLFIDEFSAQYTNDLEFRNFLKTTLKLADKDDIIARKITQFANLVQFDLCELLSHRPPYQPEIPVEQPPQP